MQGKLIVFPNNDGFSVLIWGKRPEGCMRVRHFDNRTVMVSLLENLSLISSEEAKELEQFVFINFCPVYSAEIDGETLAAHGFQITS